MIWKYFEHFQVNVDIFFIDWEKPRRYEQDDSKAHLLARQMSSTSRSESLKFIMAEARSNSVSVWRTYFVANEWNELQVSTAEQTISHTACVIVTSRINKLGVIGMHRCEAGVVLQVLRRVQPVGHIFLVLLLLDGVGLENLARYEAQSTVVGTVNN